MTTFGCGAHKPLPLEKRKDIFLALTNTLDPQMSPCRLAVAAWSAEVTMGAFWLLTQTGPRTPLRWLKDEDGNFTVEHAVKVLKGACLSHHFTDSDEPMDDKTNIKEVLCFISRHAWSNSDEIVHRAMQTGFDPSEVQDPKQSLAAALAQRSPGGDTKALVEALRQVGGVPGCSPGASRWDSRAGARPPSGERVLRRSETDDEIVRLEKRKRMLTLTKEVRQEEQAMVIAMDAGRPTENKNIALPPGLTLATGVWRGVPHQPTSHNLSPGFYQVQQTLLEQTGCSEKKAEQQKAHRSRGMLQQEIHELNTLLRQQEEQACRASEQKATQAEHEAARAEKEAHRAKEEACQVCRAEEACWAEEEAAQVAQAEQEAAEAEQEKTIKEMHALRRRLQLMEVEDCWARAKQEEACKDSEQRTHHSQEQKAHTHWFASEMAQMKSDQEEWAKQREEQQSEMTHMKQQMLLYQKMQAQARSLVKEKQRSELERMKQEILIAKEEYAQPWIKAEETQRNELAAMQQELMVAREEKQSEMISLERDVRASNEESRKQLEEQAAEGAEEEKENAAEEEEDRAAEEEDPSSSKRPRHEF